MTEQSVCIIAEDLSEPIDEGIKHFARSLIEGCRENCKVLGISTHSEGSISIPDTTSIRANKAFVNFKLRSAIRRFHPDVICYVPSASATIFSFLRSRILKLFHPDARVIMVSLQPRDYRRISRSLIRLLSPDMIFVQNPAILNKLKNFGCHVTLLPSGVDLNKFTPVSREQKTELRAKYHLDPEAFTVLHVGHSTAGRNIEFLGRVRQECRAQVIFVGSSLQHNDSVELNSLLKNKGVIVLNEYFPNIEEIYQLSDCYLFPVFSDQACIGVPLSVLEAMACNLPVVSVNYGNLQELFQEGQGLVYGNNPDELLQGIKAAGNYNGNCRTRDKVTPYSWQIIARNILKSSSGEENN